jgi:hypothetical protein
MKDYTYTAQADHMGDGWTDPEVVADRWNTYIAPVLQAATTDEMVDNEDELVVSIAPGHARLASEWAWEQFCNRDAGESDEVAELLGTELARLVE